MSTVTIAFEAKGERGRGKTDYTDDAAGNFYNSDSVTGSGMTISGNIVGLRGKTITFIRYPGGDRGYQVYYHDTDKTYYPMSNEHHGGEGGGAAALQYDTQHIVIAGGGGGQGGRHGNSGGNAGSYLITVPRGTYQGGQDGGGGDRKGKGGNSGTVGNGGPGYDGGGVVWGGNPGGNYEAGDIYSGGHGGSAQGNHSDGGGGGGAGWGGGGGGGGHSENQRYNAGSNNSGGGGGGDSMIYTTSTDDVYVSGTPTESFNTDTTAQVIITHLSQTVTLNSSGDHQQFIFSTPTTFDDTTFTFTKDVLVETINLRDEGVFTEDIEKTFTYYYRVKSVGSYVESPNALTSTNTSVFITTNNVITLARTASAVETLEMEVYTEATVTGITETSNTFTITLKFTNNTPTVSAITKSVHWNSTDNTFDFSGNDADSDSLSYSIASSSGGPFSGGPLNLTNGTVEIVNTNQFSVDSSNNATLTFYYIANDGFNDSTSAQITINKLNDKPTANAITKSVHWNSTDNIFDFSGNDANSDSLTYRIASSSGGTFTQNSLILTEGTVEIVNTNQFSVDSSNNATLTFYYKAFDGAEYSDEKMITIEKTNTAPTASNIVRFTNTDPVNITLSGSDNDPFSFSLGTTTQNYGTWSSITGGNKITYTPSGNQLGVDTANYSISDLVDSRNYTITVYSGLTNIKDGGQDLTELYKRKHDNTSGYIALTNNKSNYQVNGTDLVYFFEREDRVVTSTSNLKVTVDGTTYALDQIFKKR